LDFLIALRKLFLASGEVDSQVLLALEGKQEVVERKQRVVAE